MVQRQRYIAADDARRFVLFMGLVQITTKKASKF